jgi:hypothetical protein
LVVCQLGNVLPSPRPSRHKKEHSNRPTLQLLPWVQGTETYFN